MHPPITIFCPFSRRWAIDEWLESFKSIEHDPQLTNLCFIVDGDEPYIDRTLHRFAEAGNYRSINVKNNASWHPNEIRLSIRRQRVAELHEQAKDLVAKTNADIIVCLEDDTVMDRMPSFARLIDPISNSDAVGFVEGVQMGRWGANMIGAWLANDIQNPTQIETLLPGEGYEEVTGGGWYGCAVRRSLFLNAPYFSSVSQPWGPDVNHGFYIRQQGFQCLIDWQTVFGHRDHNQVLYPDDPSVRLAKIMYSKRDDNGKWDRTDHEQTRY